MKKNFFMLAATAALFAACAETELVNEVNVEGTPQEIGFSTYAQKATRATENNYADYAWELSNHHTGFYVWASKNIAPDSWVEVYAADAPGAVTYSTVWTANPLKYWDKAANSYEFYAAAPLGVAWKYQNATATPNDGSTGYLTLDNFALNGTAEANLADATKDTHDSWQGKGDIDLMIAADCKIPRTHYFDTTLGVPLKDVTSVNLDFIHILSRLNIAVKTDSKATIVVNALDVHKLNHAGSFDESKVSGDNLMKGTNARWEPTAVDANYVWKAAKTPLTLVKDDAVYTHEYLVLPQLQANKNQTVNQGVAPTNDAYIYIEYTVDGEVFKTYYGLAQVFGVAKDADLAFNEGWQNTLTITISPDVITFAAKTSEWRTNLNEGQDID